VWFVVALTGAALVLPNPVQVGDGGVAYAAAETTGGHATGVTTLAATATGVIYVVDANCCGGNNGAVIKIDLSKPAGQNQTVISSGQAFVQPLGVVLRSDGLLYVTDAVCCVSGSNTGAVIQVDPGQPNGSNQTVVSSGQNFVFPRGITAAADGSLYVTDAFCCVSGNSSGAVIRVDPSKPNDSNQTVISSGQNFAIPSNTVVAADGSLYVTDAVCCLSGANLGAVIRVDPNRPNGSNQTVISSGQNFTFPSDAAMTSDGLLYIVDPLCCVSGSNRGAVIRVDPSMPAGGNQTVISSGQGFVSPNGIALASTGTLIVTDTACCVSSSASGALIEVNQTLPNGGNQSLLANGQNFVAPIFAVSMPQVGIGDAPPVTEGRAGTSTPATFAVVRTPWSPLPLSIPYSAASGTATSGTDFDGSGGSVTFAAGQTSTTAIVQVIGDNLVEPTETFTVTLHPPDGVAAARATATGVILNDDTACSPVPRVIASPVAGGGKLQVHVESTPLNTLAANPITQIRFGQFRNAQVTLNGQSIQSGQTVTLPANTSTFDFTVARVTPGQATTVPFTVVDGCGDFPTFVGGGTAAGF
jgi:hypothetical protein